MAQPPSNMSLYEQRALEEIACWRNPPSSWITKIAAVATWPIDKAGDLAMDVPGLRWVLRNAVGGLVDLSNDIAQWSVRHDAIYAEFRSAGHQVEGPSDIAELDLEQVDRVIGYLAAKYKALAAGEGAATGAAGLLGIPPDIVALIAMNLRAIGEYATYFGFDVSSQQERLFAMNILGYASSPNDTSKAVVMAQLVRIGQDVAKKKAWRELQKHAFVRVLQQIAKALGIRLTKAKLAQAIPASGAAVGAGFNAYFTAKVCEAAFQLYRERFLAGKYGDSVIGGVGGTSAFDVDAAYAEANAELPDDDTPPPGA